MANKSISGLLFVFLAEMWIQANTIGSDCVNNDTDVFFWLYSDCAHCWLRLCMWRRFPWELGCQITNCLATKHLHAALIHWSMAQTQPSGSCFSLSSSLWGLNPVSEEMDQWLIISSNNIYPIYPLHRHPQIPKKTTQVLQVNGLQCPKVSYDNIPYANGTTFIVLCSPCNWVHKTLTSL